MPSTFHSKEFAIAAIAAIAALGCAPAPQPERAEHIQQTITAPACPYTEVVVDQPLGECVPLRAAAPPGTWVGEAVLTYEDKRGAGMYCRYRWEPKGQADTRSPPLSPFANRRAQVDCPLVAPSAPAFEPTYWKPLEESFRAQAGRVKSLLPGRYPTTVAVIDSAAHPFDASDVEDNSPHGRAIGRAIFDLACGEDFTATCTVRISNHLALREVGRSKQFDPKNGGFYGTRGQLAQAIESALEAWQKEVRAGSKGRLIINISLAWAQDLDRNSPLVAERTLPADVVYRALRRASCFGALSVASAGNGVPPRQRGPLHPAAWETVEAPSAEECRKVVRGDWPFLGDLDRPAKYRPMVVSVGGVDHRDVVLSTSRPGAQPRLVAPGMAVVTNDPRSASGHTALLSGSSMGAAGVSGALAAAWGHDPALPAHALLERLYETAVPLDPKISFAWTEICLGGSCAKHPVRRASACALVSSVAGPMNCTTVPAHAGAPPSLPPPPLPVSVATLPQRCFPWPWGGMFCFPIATTRTGVAPAPTDEPWVRPQPGGVCPNCRVHKGSMSMSGYLDAPLAPSLGLVWGDMYTSIWGADPIWGLGLNGYFHAWLPGSWTAPSSAYGAYEAYGIVGPPVWSEAFPLALDEY